MIALFNYTNSNQRGAAEAAVAALVRIGSAAAVPLIASLRDTAKTDDRRNPSHAIDALVKIGIPAVGPLIRALHDSATRTNAELTLRAIGAPAVPRLIAALSSRYLLASGFSISEDAACALGKVGTPAIEPLIVALNDRPPNSSRGPDVEAKKSLRAGAARALGYIGDSRVIGGLISALDDTSVSVRLEVVRALAGIRDPRACEPLLRELGKGDVFHYRLQVVNALMALGDTRADQLLVAQLRMPDASGDEAIGALKRLAETRAVEPLIDLLRHKTLGKRAAEILGTLGDLRAAEPLAAALDDENTRISSAISLVQLGDLRGVQPLLADHSVANPEWFSRNHGKLILQYGAERRNRLVPFLISEMKSKGSRRAAELLCRLDEPSVAPYLPAVILDWLELTRGQQDSGLKLMATRAGMDEETLSLAASALGNTYKTEHGSSSGGNFSWSSVGAHDMRSVTTLCQRRDIWSSCILYRVAKKKDVTVTMTTCAPSSYEVKLDFKKERQAARDELVQRGFGDTDPIIHMLGRIGYGV